MAKSSRKKKRIPPVTLKSEPSYQEVMAAIRARRKEQKNHAKRKGH